MRMSDANEESGVGALEISKSNLSVRTATLRDLGTTRSRTTATYSLYRAQLFRFLQSIHLLY